MKVTEVRIEEVIRSKYEFEKSENKNKEKALVVEDAMVSRVEEIL